MMQDFILRMGANFSKDEKEKCIPLVYKIIDLDRIVRYQGISVLESEVLPDNNDFLKLGIELMLEKIELELLEKIFQYTILADGGTGVDLLERLLIAEGLLIIQSEALSEYRAWYPTTAYVIGAMLGEEYTDRIKQYLRKTRKDFFYSYIQSYKVASPESIPFEEKLSRLTIAELNKIRHMHPTTYESIHPTTFMTAFKRCSTDFIYRLVDEGSENNFMYICDALQSIGVVSPEDALKAQEQVLNFMESLLQTN